MEELGVIGKGAGKGRALTLTEPLPEENQIPIVGTVAAGTPILAEECIEDYLTFDAGGDSRPVFCPPGSGGVHAQRRYSAGRSGGGAPAADR